MQIFRIVIKISLMLSFQKTSGGFPFFHETAGAEGKFT